MSHTRIVSIEDGADLAEALRALTSAADAWLSASGYVEAVEIKLASDGADPTRSLRGRFALTSLSGPCGGPYMVNLARATDAGIQVIGGRLLTARSLGVQVLVQVLGVEPVRAEESAAQAGPGPAPEAATGTVGSAWAAAAQATAAALSPVDDSDDDGFPEAGDLVQHFTFGLCDVLMSDGNSLKIRDRTGPGRLREIRVDMLKVEGPSDRDGKRLFKLLRKN